MWCFVELLTLIIDISGRGGCFGVASFLVAAV
jgi:hypothetical protein